MSRRLKGTVKVKTRSRRPREISNRTVCGLFWTEESVQEVLTGALASSHAQI